MWGKDFMEAGFRAAGFPVAVFRERFHDGGFTDFEVSGFRCFLRQVFGEQVFWMRKSGGRFQGSSFFKVKIPIGVSCRDFHLACFPGIPVPCRGFTLIGYGGRFQARFRGRFQGTFPIGVSGGRLSVTGFRRQVFRGRISHRGGPAAGFPRAVSRERFCGVSGFPSGFLVAVSQWRILRVSRFRGFLRQVFWMRSDGVFSG